MFVQNVYKRLVAILERKWAAGAPGSDLLFVTPFPTRQKNGLILTFSHGSCVYLEQFKLRQILASHVELARKLEALEKKYDSQFKIVFDAIRQLMAPKEASNKRRGREGAGLNI